MALNDNFFDQHALERARGAAPTGSGWPEYNGGILLPKRVHVRPGQYLYRFASSTAPHDSRLRGCWWIEYEVLRKIARFATKHGETRRDAVRYFLALPWSWTRVDRLIRALVVAPLDAYRGEGNPAAGSHPRDAGTRFIPPQHSRELYQLFIPGLDQPGVAEQAFSDVTDTDVWKAPQLA